MVVLTAHSCFIDGLGTSFTTGNLPAALNAVFGLWRNPIVELWAWGEKEGTIMGIVI